MYFMLIQIQGATVFLLLVQNRGIVDLFVVEIGDLQPRFSNNHGLSAPSKISRGAILAYNKFNI